MTGAPKAIVSDIMAVKETAAHLVDAFAAHARAFVQVQNGCDHRCTFCIIPFGRGNSRSVPMGAVVDEVRRLVGNGYREIVLTGVDITSYGADLPGAPKLGALVKQILKHVPELEAAAAVLDRFGRGRPRSARCARERAAADAASASVAAVRRRSHPQAHEAAAFARRRHRLLREVRRLRPDVVFGADLIAGFPTETDAMFERSLDLVDECGLTHLHVFPFSPRPGTPAARMPQVDRAVVKERARRLRERGAAVLRRHLDGEIGATRRVLMESQNAGHTEQFTKVMLAAPGRARHDPRRDDRCPRRQTIAGGVR